MVRLTRERVFAAAALLVLLTVVTTNRLQGQRPDQAEPTTFRGGVEVVELDVSVLDKTRQPIPGLTAENFSIFEDGKRRPVVAFAAIDLTGAAPVTSATIGAGRGLLDQASEGRLVVILMDRSISVGAATQIARRVAVEAVREMGPNDLGAVIYTGAGLKSQDITGSRAQLIVAITGVTPGATSATGSADGRVMNDRLEADTFPTDPKALPRVLPDYDYSGECMCGLCVHETITHIADAVRQFPRRTKSLLFIGTDIPMETRQVQCASKTNDARSAMFRAVDLSHLTVHAFDASGLETRALGASISVQGKDLTSPISPRRGSLSEVEQARERQMVRHGNLSVLPSRTGGRTVLNTNTPHDAMPDVFRENASYYVLAFEPAAKLDGKRHDVRVRVDRREAEVFTRRHYLRAKNPN
jgi:VWFA-related protein